MTETDKAWLAGFIDGEGHIGLQRINSHGRFFYNVRIQITQANLPVLQHVAKLTNHNRIHTQHRAMENQSAAWVWRCDMTVAIQVLKTVLPYLIYKKPQAELAIAFAEHWYANRPKKKPRGKEAEPVDYATFEAYKDQMHALNARGALRAG